ncbi:MAG: hypothetical protein QGI86_06585 [Candidatus Poribacteria bacterium]|jgi:D-aminopeptidase|nr:hypothetical protein [Candidatus Poribacteria bacterium]MDP6750098.1 hypothetical protein [Candidatus Poribacteria bacterium]MDP6960307.1 hypothetical protein [Dehalococcoidia bacterium]
MRILSLSEMEGLAGIDCWVQVTDGDPRHTEARQMYPQRLQRCH